MKQYQATREGSFTTNNMTIPASTGNRHYQQLLEEVEQGEAEVLSYIPPISTWDSLNQERVQSLAVIDLKSIRALREGDSVRVNELEAQAQAIRDTFEVPNG